MFMSMVVLMQTDMVQGSGQRPCPQRGDFVSPLHFQSFMVVPQSFATGCSAVTKPRCWWKASRPTFFVLIASLPLVLLCIMHFILSSVGNRPGGHH